MVTPKEKALELRDKFDWLSDYPVNCADIIVDEVLSLSHLTGSDLSDEFYIFWEEVKLELYKL